MTDSREKPSAAARYNRAHYQERSEGREDYWRKMAAPRHRVAVLSRELCRRQPRAIIDLGCGDGSLLAELARSLPAARLAGVDLSARQIEANRARMPRVAWSCADLDRPVAWPEDLAGGCDAVVASEVIEHVDHPRVFLANALALARRGGGRLYLSTQSGPVRETERRVGHIRHFSAAEMRELLVAAGWRQVRTWNTGFPFHDLSKWYANRDPDATMARFGEHAYGLREDLVCLALRVAFRLNSRRRGAQLFAVAERA